LWIDVGDGLQEEDLDRGGTSLTPPFRKTIKLTEPDIVRRKLSYKAIKDHGYPACRPEPYGAPDWIVFEALLFVKPPWSSIVTFLIRSVAMFLYRESQAFA
jgi:hypothetical protein